jgi:hypothetical protein
MKLRILAAGTMAFAVAAGSTPARAQGPVSVGIAAGATIPSGDFSDMEKTGYHFMGSLAFGAPILPVGFRIDGMWNQFTGKSNSGLLGTFDNTDFRVLNATGNVVFQLPGAIVAKPYLIGGLGAYWSKPDVDGESYKSKLGYNVGIGVKTALSGFGAFAEVRWHQVPDVFEDANGNKSSLTMIPLTFGILF